MYRPGACITRNRRLIVVLQHCTRLKQKEIPCDEHSSKYGYLHGKSPDYQANACGIGTAHVEPSRTQLFYHCQLAEMGWGSSMLKYPICGCSTQIHNGPVKSSAGNVIQGA